MKVIGLVLLCIHYHLLFGEEISDWFIQSTKHISDNGEVISTPGYDTTNWYPVKVPATVIAGLVQNGVYKNPYYSKNLQQMNSKDFDVPWWYRTVDFPIQENPFPAKVVRISFKGINYKADVYFNGNLIGALLLFS